MQIIHGTSTLNDFHLQNEQLTVQRTMQNKKNDFNEKNMERTFESFEFSVSEKELRNRRPNNELVVTHCLQ